MTTYNFEYPTGTSGYPKNAREIKRPGTPFNNSNWIAKGFHLLRSGVVEPDADNPIYKSGDETTTH